MRTFFFLHPMAARGLALFLWMGVIFFFSSLHGSEYPYEPTLAYYLERKGAHVVEYAVLTLLAVRFLFALFPRETFRTILLSASVFAVVYGISDELHQFFVPYRGAKISDVGVDTVGVFLTGSMFLAMSFRQKKKQREQKSRR